MKGAEKYLNINCHSREKAKGITGEIDGALLIFFSSKSLKHHSQPART